jgi:hypothetical protein
MTNFKPKLRLVVAMFRQNHSKEGARCDALRRSRQQGAHHSPWRRLRRRRASEQRPTQLILRDFEITRRAQSHSKKRASWKGSTKHETGGIRINWSCWLWQKPGEERFISMNQLQPKAKIHHEWTGDRIRQTEVNKTHCSSKNELIPSTFFWTRRITSHTGDLKRLKEHKLWLTSNDYPQHE